MSINNIEGEKTDRFAELRDVLPGAYITKAMVMIARLRQQFGLSGCDHLDVTPENVDRVLGALGPNYRGLFSPCPTGDTRENFIGTVKRIDNDGYTPAIRGDISANTLCPAFQLLRSGTSRNAVDVVTLDKACLFEHQRRFREQLFSLFTGVMDHDQGLMDMVLAHGPVSLPLVEAFVVCFVMGLDYSGDLQDQFVDLITRIDGKSESLPPTSCGGHLYDADGKACGLSPYAFADPHEYRGAA